LKSKQGDGGYDKCAREFSETVTDLKAQGSAEVILQALINVAFVLGLDKAQFETRLNEIFSSAEWPQFADLKQELTKLTEIKRSLGMLNENNQDDKVAAHAAAATTDDRECHNCGTIGHIRSNCLKPPSNCGFCHRDGHIEKFCNTKQRGAREDMPRADRGYAGREGSFQARAAHRDVGRDSRKQSGADPRRTKKIAKLTGPKRCHLQPVRGQPRLRQI
jgi:hypothetical protein